MSLISRKEALWTFQDRVCYDIACDRCPMTDDDGTCRIDDWLKELPSAEIVRCKDCRKHNKAVNDDVPYKEDACPLISWRGKAQGHEYDYQYCPYGERK